MRNRRKYLIYYLISSFIKDTGDILEPIKLSDTNEYVKISRVSTMLATGKSHLTTIMDL